ncbi:hypothetical protein AAII07_32650 [Microvirga sp. 0TCS3.31]
MYQVSKRHIRYTFTRFGIDIDDLSEHDGCNMQRAAVLIGFFILATGCSAQATEHCSFRAVGGREGIWIAPGEADACDVKRVVTPTYDCRIWIMFQHGYQGFRCGNDLNGKWGASGIGFQGAALTTIGTSRRVKLPEHSQLRKTWLAPIDEEGLNKSYPISMDDYIDYYPRRFTEVKVKISLENPEFRTATQTLHYVTMKGEKRVAVTGEATLDCLRLYFYTWVEPAKSGVVERDMAAFLKDLRLEPVTATGERRDRACPRRN